MKRIHATSILTFITIVTLIGLFVTLNSFAEINIIHVTTSPTSSRYPWGMALGEVINKYVDGVTCKTRGIGSTMMMLPMLVKGEAQMATHVGLLNCEEAYLGTGLFEGEEPSKNTRGFCIRETPLILLFVTKDSGIKSMKDLKGKKISAGLPESFTRESALKMEEALNTGVIYSFDSLGNAITMLKNRQLDGIWTSSPGIPPGPNYGTEFNALMLEINATIPLTIVGFTEEEKDKIAIVFPVIRWNKVLAGGVEDLPELDSFWAYRSGWTGAIITTDIPQDIQYKIIKAWDEHWDDEIAISYPPCGMYDPIRDTLDLTIAWGSNIVPLAAGFVQYALEKGYDVPAELIPPEYQESK